MNKNLLLYGILAVLFLTLSFGTAGAQEFRGAISGSVFTQV